MSDTAQATDTSKITIYSTPWCAFCKTEKQWLASLGYTYVEKDIENDKAAYEELMAKSGGNYSGVPVTDVAGDLILGFDRPRLTAAIETHGLKPVAA